MITDILDILTQGTYTRCWGRKAINDVAAWGRPSGYRLSTAEALTFGGSPRARDRIVLAPGITEWWVDYQDTTWGLRDMRNCGSVAAPFFWPVRAVETLPCPHITSMCPALGAREGGGVSLNSGSIAEVP